MLSTQSRTLIHQVPVLTPFFQISSLTLTRKASSLSRRLRAPSATPPAGPSAFFLAEQQQLQFVWRYPLSDFAGLGGNVIVTSEAGIQGADTSLVTVVGNTYVQSSFAPESPA